MSVNVDLEALRANLKSDIDKRIDALKPVPQPSGGFVLDDFQYVETFKVGQKSNNGKWITDFVGQGFAKTDGNGLIISPASTTLDIYGGSAQVRSVSQFGNCAFDVEITNEKRTVTVNPQQWMCPWFLFRHLDKWRHYYFYVGTDHMEFGKKDAPVGLEPQSEIEKYQKILWDGGPKTPIGTKCRVGVEMIGDRFKMYYNGSLVMDLTDVSSFKAGSLSPYTEGAQSRYQMIRVTPK